MALHINGLPIYPYNVLELILYLAASAPADTLAEWKSKLPLVAVCRAWTKIAQPFVFRHVIVEVLRKCTNRGYFTGETFIRWKSNAELFIPRHCVLMARRLSLALPKCMTPDNFQLIALDILKLDRVDWMHINTLVVSEASPACNHYIVPVDDDSSARDKVEHALQFFAQNLRNISELSITVCHLGHVGDIVREKLATMYGRQMTLDHAAGRKLPDVCGETLRVLKLSKVPQNFAWRRFRYDIFVRPIVFPRLTILHLDYDGLDAELTEDEIQSRVSSGARNCDQLCFPALKELIIYNCTPDCDLLYADTPFPELDKVTLIGSFHNIRHCSRLKLVWVGGLQVKFWTLLDNVTTGIHIVANPLFTNICIGRTAALDFGRTKFVIDPEAIRWVNLTALSVYTVSYQTLCKLIARLPNLTRFRTINLEFDDFYADESLFRSMDPMLAWGERLVTIGIIQFSKGSSHAVQNCSIQALIVNAGALVELYVPEDVVTAIESFIDSNMRHFAHLANVNVIGY
ncbi:hypothetical protein IWW38_003731, partial [Coemansia aciculifera]